MADRSVDKAYVCVRSNALQTRPETSPSEASYLFYVRGHLGSARVGKHERQRGQTRQGDVPTRHGQHAYPSGTKKLNKTPLRLSSAIASPATRLERTTAGVGASCSTALSKRDEKNFWPREMPNHYALVACQVANLTDLAR